MREPKLLKKFEQKIKYNKEVFVIFSVLIIGLLGIVYRTNQSYAIETFNGSMMNTFPSIITDQKENISAVYFIKDTQGNIDTRYNKASIKADLTYNSTGSVKGWLETDSKDNTKYILYVGSKDTIYLNTGYKLFYEWKNVTTIDFANIDTSKVTDMSYMLYWCNMLASLNIGGFDTSNVTNMYRMFYFCQSLTSLNFNSFNTSKVTNMAYMFFSCIGFISLNLSNFNTSNTADMSHMFSGCTGLTNLNISSLIHRK